MVFNGYTVLPEGDATLRDENGLLYVEDRKFKYSSLALKVPLLKNGKTRFIIKLKSGAPDIFVTLYHKIIYLFNNEEVIDYDGGTKRKITDKEWVEIDGTYSTPKNCKEVLAYFIEDSDNVFPDIIVKEICNEEIFSEKTALTIAPQPFTVGAIRWDAYFSTNHPERNVSREVAKALSPEEFHFRAPYFSIINNQGNVEFPEETQEQFDNEMQLASDAGIDYFAYCWYRENDIMSYARKRHLKSKLRKKVKMAAIINVSSLDDESVTALCEATKDDCYLKFDGHPVIYVFNAVNSLPQLRQRITDLLIEKGLKTPFFIGMNASPTPYSVTRIKHSGFDGIGSYGFSAKAQGEDFSSFAKRNQDMCRLRNGMDIEHIPLLCLGHDFRPRIKNPVSWMGGNNFSYVATDDEIYLHAKNIFEIQKENSSNSNTMLIYAWNEHDEGGWICPTLSGDGYYQAIKKAIKEYKETVL